MNFMENLEKQCMRDRFNETLVEPILGEDRCSVQDDSLDIDKENMSEIRDKYLHLQEDNNRLKWAVIVIGAVMLGLIACVIPAL